MEDLLRAAHPPGDEGRGFLGANLAPLIDSERRAGNGEAPPLLHLCGGITVYSRTLH